MMKGATKISNSSTSSSSSSSLSATNRRRMMMTVVTTADEDHYHDHLDEDYHHQNEYQVNHIYGDEEDDDEEVEEELAAANASRSRSSTTTTSRLQAQPAGQERSKSAASANQPPSQTVISPTQLQFHHHAGAYPPTSPGGGASRRLEALAGRLNRTKKHRQWMMSQQHQQQPPSTQPLPVQSTSVSRSQTPPAPSLTSSVRHKPLAQPKAPQPKQQQSKPAQPPQNHKKSITTTAKTVTVDTDERPMSPRRKLLEKARRSGLSPVAAGGVERSKPSVTHAAEEATRTTPAPIPASSSFPSTAATTSSTSTTNQAPSSALSSMPRWNQYAQAHRKQWNPLAVAAPVSTTKTSPPSTSATKTASQTTSSSTQASSFVPAPVHSPTKAGENGKSPTSTSPPPTSPTAKAAQIIRDHAGQKKSRALIQTLAPTPTPATALHATKKPAATPAAETTPVVVPRRQPQPPFGVQPSAPSATLPAGSNHPSRGSVAPRTVPSTPAFTSTSTVAKKPPSHTPPPSSTIWSPPLDPRRKYHPASSSPKLAHTVAHKSPPAALWVEEKKEDHDASATVTSADIETPHRLSVAMIKARYGAKVPSTETTPHRQYQRPNSKLDQTSSRPTEAVVATVTSEPVDPMMPSTTHHAADPSPVAAAQPLASITRSRQDPAGVVASSWSAKATPVKVAVGSPAVAPPSSLPSQNSPRRSPAAMPVPLAAPPVFADDQELVVMDEDSSSSHVEIETPPKVKVSDMAHRFSSSSQKAQTPDRHQHSLSNGYQKLSMQPLRPVAPRSVPSDRMSSVSASSMVTVKLSNKLSERSMPLKSDNSDMVTSEGFSADETEVSSAVIETPDKVNVANMKDMFTAQQQQQQRTNISSHPVRRATPPANKALRKSMAPPMTPPMRAKSGDRVDVSTPHGPTMPLRPQSAHQRPGVRPDLSAGRSARRSLSPSRRRGGGGPAWLRQAATQDDEASSDWARQRPTPPRTMRSPSPVLERWDPLQPANGSDFLLAQSDQIPVDQPVTSSQSDSAEDMHAMGALAAPDPPLDLPSLEQEEMGESSTPTLPPPPPPPTADPEILTKASSDRSTSQPSKASGRPANTAISSSGSSLTPAFSPFGDEEDDEVIEQADRWEVTGNELEPEKERSPLPKPPRMAPIDTEAPITSAPAPSPRQNMPRPWKQDLDTLSPRNWKQQVADHFDSDIENKSQNRDAFDPANLRSSTTSHAVVASPHSLKQLAADSIHATDFDQAMKGLSKKLTISADDDDTLQENSPDGSIPHELPPEFASALARGGTRPDHPSIGARHVADESSESKRLGNRDIVFGSPETFGAAGGEQPVAPPSVADRAKAIADWKGGIGARSKKSDSAIEAIDGRSAAFSELPDERGVVNQGTRAPLPPASPAKPRPAGSNARGSVLQFWSTTRGEAEILPDQWKDRDPDLAEMADSSVADGGATPQLISGLLRKAESSKTINPPRSPIGITNGKKATGASASSLPPDPFSPRAIEHLQPNSPTKPSHSAFDPFWSEPETSIDFSNAGFDTSFMSNKDFSFSEFAPRPVEEFIEHENAIHPSRRPLAPIAPPSLDSQDAWSYEACDDTEIGEV